MQNDVESLYVFYLKFERNVSSHAFPLYSSGKICVGFFFYEPYPITEDNFNIYKEKIWSSLGQFTPSVS